MTAADIKCAPHSQEGANMPHPRCAVVPLCKPDINTQLSVNNAFAWNFALIRDPFCELIIPQLDITDVPAITRTCKLFRSLITSNIYRVNFSSRFHYMSKSSEFIRQCPPSVKQIVANPSLFRVLLPNNNYEFAFPEAPQMLFDSKLAGIDLSNFRADYFGHCFIEVLIGNRKFPEWSKNWDRDVYFMCLAWLIQGSVDIPSDINSRILIAVKNYNNGIIYALSLNPAYFSIFAYQEVKTRDPYIHHCIFHLFKSKHWSAFKNHQAVQREAAYLLLKRYPWVIKKLRSNYSLCLDSSQSKLSVKKIYSKIRSHAENLSEREFVKCAGDWLAIKSADAFEYLYESIVIRIKGWNAYSSDEEDELIEMFCDFILEDKKLFVFKHNRFGKDNYNVHSIFSSVKTYLADEVSPHFVIESIDYDYLGIIINPRLAQIIINAIHVAKNVYASAK